MKEDARLALHDFALKRITKDALVARIGVDPSRDGAFVRSGLEHALVERAGDEIGLLMVVGAHFGAWPEWAPVLGELLLADWHTQHEDIANTLQNLRQPGSVEALFQAAQAKFDYRSYDEAESLGVRCLWALHDIGTPDAAARLRILAKHESKILSAQARRLVALLTSRRAGDPVDAYRRHRDERVHWNK